MRNEEINTKTRSNLIPFMGAAKPKALRVLLGIMKKK